MQKKTSSILTSKKVPVDRDSCVDMLKTFCPSAVLLPVVAQANGRANSNAVCWLTFGHWFFLSRMLQQKFFKHRFWHNYPFPGLFTTSFSPKQGASETSKFLSGTITWSDHFKALRTVIRAPTLIAPLKRPSTSCLLCSTICDGVAPSRFLTSKFQTP